MFRLIGAEAMHAFLEIAGRIVQVIFFLLDVLSALLDLFDLGRWLTGGKAHEAKGETPPKAISPAVERALAEAQERRERQEQAQAS